MDKEELKQKHNERKKAYYSLRGDVDNMRYKLQDLGKHRGHSSAYKVLISALDVFRDQVSADFNRYERRIRFIDNSDTALELQQALNRERKLRQELENKIKEASESSGLFISYVRSKLKF